MVSIIIPALNEENYLPLLLQSIKNQDFKGEYEIIVADAGSIDKTREIAKIFGCKIVKGGLPAKGRNEGVKIAKGDILLFIDADVILPKDFLQKTIKEVSKRNLDVAGFLIFPVAGEKFIYRLIFQIYNFWISKGFDEDIKIGEDHWYVRQASKYGKFGIIKSTKVFASMRRFEKDGLIKTCLKYIFAGIYMLLFGPIKKEFFKYEFNHYKNNPLEKI